jgi:hypothetical protein
MNKSLHYPALVLLASAAAGCHFKTPTGGALRLKEYDSIQVEQVELAPSITEKAVAPLLKGYTEVAVLECNEWKLAGDFDLESFAATVEEYSTTAGTINGKPVEPLMTREQFLAEHAKAQSRWKAKAAQPRGAKPVSLRILVTEMRFPENLEAVTMGTKPRMRCKVDVYDQGKLLGTGLVEAISGVPGVPLHPAAMVGRAAEAMLFDAYTRKAVLKLVTELGHDTVWALETTK